MDCTGLINYSGSMDEPSKRAAALLRRALATLVLFAAHHAYGAMRYDTPWRNHAGVVAFFVGLAILAAYGAYRWRPRALLGGIFAGLVVVVPVVLVGAVEGGYNHAFKVAVWALGAPRDVLESLFPPPTYELPNDVWFEASGVLQAVVAASAGVAALRFVRAMLPSCRRSAAGPKPS
jgi:hypothetical protein